MRILFWSALLLVPLPAISQTPALPDPPPDTLARACSGPEFRRFDFWLGRWSVAVPGRAPRAVNSITRETQGCLLQERFHNDSGYTGSSINWYDPTDRLWRQIWIDNAGLILHLEGDLDSGGRMVLSGNRRSAEGQSIRDRISWIAQPDGSVHQIWDVSEDQGQTWRNFFTGVYVPLRVPGQGGDVP